jgi:hypothetical protein
MEGIFKSDLGICKIQFIITRYENPGNKWSSEAG